MPSNLQREHTCYKFRKLMRETWTCDACGDQHDREFSCLCEDCEDREGETALMECNYCSEIELPVEGGECRSCGVPQYF